MPLMIALLLASAPGGGGASSNVRAYFPPQTATYECRYGDDRVTRPMVDDTVLASFAEALAKAGEPALATPRDDGRTIVRFTWLRSFHAPIVLRLTVLPDGAGHLDMVRLSGLGGYELGSVEDRQRWDVASTDIAAVLQAADPARLRPVEPGCGPPGADGAGWLIERQDARGFQFASRWSPRDGVVREVGMLLLQLGGSSDEEIY